ncbi:MAG TPA: flagellar motor switch protein FliG [Porticoccaceae bacterium]|nr:flagellar motor switch protein FliG [Porticoccaceae bacterium]
MAEPKLTGAERAAVFLMSVGEAHAASVLKLIGPKEVQKIGAVMAGLKNISRQQVNAVIEDFTTAVDEHTNLGIGNEEYVRKVLVNALGEDKASGLIDRILLGRNSKGLEALKWMDPRAVAEVIRLEHPQIIAIVLAYLDSDQAAAVLQSLPENMRAAVLMRIASLDGIQPQALHELDEILERQFHGKANVKSSSVGGPKAAADILNFVDGSAEAKIMESISESDETLAGQIQELMFVFNDLAQVDGRGIQVLLREVTSDTLVMALKGADEGVKEKIFANMSKRAAEMLRDDLEAKGPARLSDVEAAQKEILAIARRLSDAGTIALGGRSADQFV